MLRDATELFMLWFDLLFLIIFQNSHSMRFDCIFSMFPNCKRYQLIELL